MELQAHAEDIYRDDGADWHRDMAHAWMSVGLVVEWRLDALGQGPGLYHGGGRDE